MSTQISTSGNGDHGAFGASAIRARCEGGAACGEAPALVSGVLRRAGGPRGGGCGPALSAATPHAAGMLRRGCPPTVRPSPRRVHRAGQAFAGAPARDWPWTKGSSPPERYGQPEESFTSHQPMSMPSRPSRGRTCQTPQRPSPSSARATRAKR